MTEQQTCCQASFLRTLLCQHASTEPSLLLTPTWNACTTCTHAVVSDKNRACMNGGQVCQALLPLLKESGQVIVWGRGNEHPFPLHHLFLTDTITVCFASSWEEVSWGCVRHLAVHCVEGISMAVAGGIQCVKYLMFAFNLVFWIGLFYILSSLIALGMYVCVEKWRSFLK